MVRVNRNQLSDKDTLQLLRQFDVALAKLAPAHITVLLNELLGKEERLTVAKRLVAIILIHQGYSEYKVSQLLKLSHSTTKIIADKLEGGAYDGILRLLGKRNVGFTELLNSVMSILHLGGILPRRVGLDRYRTIEERRATYHSPKANPRKRHP